MAIVVGAAGCGLDPSGTSAEPLNVLVISIDTLRADRLGCYGYGRETSPAIDRFAARSVRFEHVVAESPWTLPSHVTLFSGLYPTTHGVQRPNVRPGADVRLLAERLQSRGYETIAMTAGGWMRAKYGLDRGFDTFLEQPQDFARTLEQAETLLRHSAERGPFLAFLHTYDVHCPYDPPEEYLLAFEAEGSERFAAEGGCGRTRFNGMELSVAQLRHISDRYDAGISWVDDALDSFFEFLKDEGLLENTIVVITSDHGEELGEHGRIGHGHTLYREVLEVPLIIRVPGIQPRVIHETAGLVDVMPTLLDLLAIEYEPLDGRSFATLLRGGAAPAPVAGRLSELDWSRRLRGWMTSDAHLIVDRDTGEHWFFDLHSDPSEATPVLGESARGWECEQAFERFVASLESVSRATEAVEPADEGELEALRQLGY